MPCARQPALARRFNSFGSFTSFTSSASFTSQCPFSRARKVANKFREPRHAIWTPLVLPANLRIQSRNLCLDHLSSGSVHIVTNIKSKRRQHGLSSILPDVHFRFVELDFFCQRRRPRLVRSRTRSLSRRSRSYRGLRHCRSTAISIPRARLRAAEFVPEFPASPALVRTPDPAPRATRVARQALCC
jgi:hypothetical protein